MNERHIPEEVRDIVDARKMQFRILVENRANELFPVFLKDYNEYATSPEGERPACSPLGDQLAQAAAIIAAIACVHHVAIDHLVEERDAQRVAAWANDQGKLEACISLFESLAPSM